MDRKKIAAVTGVLYFLNEEETALRDSAKPSVWALFGRRSIMEARNLVQRRIHKINRTFWR